MNVNDFKNKIEPTLPEYLFEYSFFSDGDFGDLDRVEFKGHQKIGAVEFWSKGYVGIDIYDIQLDDQIFNILISPEEEPSEAIERLMKILYDIKINNN
ncbi:hypothetical protein SB6421_04869 [Klebsiella huaxiensis]|uniref:CdiI immunity protein domain-containing protein n=1 Tax=Klebsiella huaxiensis TaxID=2153354 RepID=A0ABT6EB72_9ENTR|nr:hypothetical protein [Klebsiella huaxiensis]MDG1642596.1 hypothetical protein [Klebsiella huaxiensis]VUT06842.1 hypothetical protein SB6421_04869 [Klebsiella huaxiensis]